MFRSFTKKKRPTVSSSRSTSDPTIVAAAKGNGDGDDIDSDGSTGNNHYVSNKTKHRSDEDTVVGSSKRLKHKQRNRQRSRGLNHLSFHDDKDDNEAADDAVDAVGFGRGNDAERRHVRRNGGSNGDGNSSISSKRRKQQRKRSGLGFGGAATTETTDQYEEEKNVDDVDVDDKDQNIYSKESLSKLLHEQKEQQKQVQVQAQAAAVIDDDARINVTPMQTQRQDTISTTTGSTGIASASMTDDTLHGLHAEEYIPFVQPACESSGGSNIHNNDEILTGDDALAYDTSSDMETSNKNHPILVPTSDFSTNCKNINKEDEDEEWETEVIRRAGLKDPPERHATDVLSVPMTSSHNNHDDNNGNASTLNHDNNNNPITLLNQLRTRIITTIETIQYNQGDIERQNQRRLDELRTNRELMEQQQNTLQSVGTMYEFYQTWRNEYIIWIGAIRQNLYQKVESILSSLHSIEHDIAATARYKEYYDHDVIIVMYEHEVNEQTIGSLDNVRQLSDEVQIDTKNNQNETMVDEFGRSRISQSKLQREKRRLRRRRICEQQRNRSIDITIDATNIILENEPLHQCRCLGDIGTASSHCILRGDESDGLISDNEIETYRERHEALQGALVVATNEIHEDYVTLHKLITFFTQWYETYPDEYKTLQASNSFIELAAVLIQAELCSLNDPWNKSGGYNESKWITAIHMAMNDHKILESVHIERLFMKCVLPTVSDLLLNNKAMNILSTRQTRSLHAFIIRLQTLLPPINMIWIKLINILTSYIVQSLDDITIVTINKDRMMTQFVRSDTTTGSVIHNGVNDNRKEEYYEALYSASWGQMYRIRKILRNIFQYWVPVIQNESVFRTVVVKFVCDKFIRLIVSVQAIEHLWQNRNNNGLSETPTDFFHQVYKPLIHTGWLDLPEHTEASTTVQAAMIVFQIETENKQTSK